MLSENPKKYLQVQGLRMAYVERGSGAPMLFLHGNPTSSFVWRNVIAPLQERYRCLAPDLAGMGDSDKLTAGGPDRYSFFEQQRYLDGFIEGLRLERPLILVVHDWGSALGFDWARRYPERVRGIAYMESIVGVRDWQDMPPRGRELFKAILSDQGEQLMLEQNLFIEQMLPGGILRTLSAEEHDEYRRPFREPGEGRRPTLSWPRQLPFEGEPPEICALVERYAAAMLDSPIPKLFVNAKPGRLLVGPARQACRRWRNQEEVSVNGLHDVQEDSPSEIANAISSWASSLP